MEKTTVIKSFAALAHEGRLSLIRRLFIAGPAGMASGDLASAQNINASTASAQLLVLLNAGLVETRRQGKQVIYHAQFDKFQDIMAFFLEDCCAGNSDVE